MEEKILLHSAKKIEEEFNDISSIIRSNKTYWIGESAEAHYEFYESKKNDIEDSLANLLKNVKKIEGFADDLENELPSDVF